MMELRRLYPDAKPYAMMQLGDSPVELISYPYFQTCYETGRETGLDQPMILVRTTPGDPFTMAEVPMNELVLDSVKPLPPDTSLGRGFILLCLLWLAVITFAYFAEPVNTALTTQHTENKR